jgi:anti-sigma factor RsiW
MMRWSCRRLRAALVDAAEGRLADRTALDAHLAGCADCRRRLAAMQTVRAALRTPEIETPDDEFFVRQRQAVMRRIRPREDAASALVPAWRWLGAVATVAIVLLVARIGTRAPVESDLPPATAEQLDDDVLFHLHDLLPSFTSAGGSEEGESELASVPDLGDDELDGLSELLGAGS